MGFGTWAGSGSIIQRLGAHHAAVELLRVRMCPHPLLHLAVRAAFAVQVRGRVTRDRQVGVEGAGGQRAVEQVLVRAQVVPLGGGGAGQAQVRVVGAAAAAHPGASLLAAQLSDLDGGGRGRGGGG